VSDDDNVGDPDFNPAQASAQADAQIAGQG
jgi:hypothetical protein